jgi:dethiobiotin synthetase
MSLIAVVGTDTGVGKTTVTVGLIQALRRQGFSTGVFKPVETGVDKDSRENDAQTLARAAGQPVSVTLGASYPLSAAPLAAARERGRPVSLQTLDRQLEQLAAQHPIVLIEGAGGLLVPFAEHTLWVDLLTRWETAALVVGRLGLGTINHTLLTLSELRNRQIPILGVILNSLDPPGPETHHTPGLLAEFGNIDVIVIIGHGETDPELLCTTLAASPLLERITSQCRIGRRSL